MNLDTVLVALLVGGAVVYVLLKAVARLRQLGRRVAAPGPTRCGGCTLCPGPDSHVACAPPAPPASP